MSTVLKTMADALITAMHQVSSVNVQPVGFLVTMVSLVILISQKSKLHAVILALISRLTSVSLLVTVMMTSLSV